MLIQEQKKKEVIMDVRIQAIHFDATAQLEAFIQKKFLNWSNTSMVLYWQRLH